MKKLFIVLAVASLGFVACNNEGETTPAEDTTKTAPAPEMAPAAGDTTNAGDTMTAPAGDTTAPAAH